MEGDTSYTREGEECLAETIRTQLYHGIPRIWAEEGVSRAKLDKNEKPAVLRLR